ncbi:hypothetical protein N5C47_11315, partial [Stenotrophomonas maltophilia]|uniref:hypothetical protein n=1 Tax=Stenotrophomonas maltophilia TaxID=40324 RepID=UPI002446E65E
MSTLVDTHYPRQTPTSVGVFDPNGVRAVFAENGSDPGHEKAGEFPGFFVVGWRAVERLAGEGWLAVLRCWRATE